MVNFPLGSRIDHVYRPLAVGACQARGGSEQSADERALAVDLATVLAEVDAVQVVQRGGVFAFGFDGQPCHLLRGRGHRAAAVVAADDAGEGRNALAQLFDFSIVGGHGASPFLSADYFQTRFSRFSRWRAAITANSRHAHASPAAADIHACLQLGAMPGPVLLS